MDSGNSGSVQSSSGDEEYDSRPESLPAFLNPSAHFGASLLPHHHQQQQQPQPTLFDPPPNLFHTFSQSPTNPILNPDSSLLNLDVMRSRGLRSDPSCTDLGGNLPASSSSSASQAAILGGGQGSSHQGPLSSMQLGSTPDHNNNGGRSSSPADQTHVVTRNPKKRTRASRRAPTTVLTTDTSNFRAMVQEFTGIPAPPFSGSPFSRRLDLFGTVGSGLRSGHLEPMGPLYPLRPSPQKVHHQQSPFVSSSNNSSFLNNSLVDAANIAASNNNNNNTSTNNNNNNSTNTTTSISATSSSFNTSSINYHQLPSDHLGLPKQPQSLINMQNQMLPFHSLLQSAPPPPPPPLHPSLNVSGLGAKSPRQSLPLSSLDELGMGHGHVNANLGGLPSQGSTEGMRLSNEGSQDHLRSFDGNNYGNMQRVNSCKLNYSASASSDFNHDKVLENVSSRGTHHEGAVDSWIPSEFRIGD
ncbi:hypothetical protein Tsubulata_023736 [Turnera subulata]|uniref:VQ domain-containing protein n=1 Tax=Turnera subulata TaxID=218843 RepID=A0A9Q0FZA1_9ROSI|nr:hypothetical protein Tsubulata_023736 [Turnera subulata]